VSSLKNEIKKNKSRIFRRAYIKRRLLATGLPESDWLEITEDVKRWGSITQKIDLERQNRVRFSAAQVTVANDVGRYNPSDNESSLWFGYASQQRTLFKIEAGYLHQTLGADGIWTNTEFDSIPSVFFGVIQGDFPITSKNDMPLKASPLQQIFRDYPARNLTGFTSTGLTSSQFVGLLRDQTDGSSNFIFRPFFGDTTTNWNIETTSVTYPNLNTNTGLDIRDKTVWQIVEKLAEAENFMAYVDNKGIFNFIDKASISTATAYEFHGFGSNNREYGHTIKENLSFGFKQSKYYSRVELKWKAENTLTSYEVVESAFAVSGTNNPWNFGHRTFGMENLYLNTSTAATTLATKVFNEISGLKNEISFNSNFVPHLNINSRLSMNYDSNPTDPDSLWDSNDWADTSGAADLDTQLLWDNNLGSSISLNGSEYRPLLIRLDLDKLDTKIVAREL